MSWGLLFSLVPEPAKEIFLGELCALVLGAFSASYPLANFECSKKCVELIKLA